MPEAFKTPYQRFGKYMLLDRINIGGMAEVFRGKVSGAEGFHKLVAIKRILPTIAEDEDFIEMFVNEAKMAVQLQHANIVQIFDLNQVEGRYYIAMEYVSGVDLRSVWDRARRRNRLLPIAMSCYLVQRVCEGLDYAHRKRDEVGREIGIVHRDVSPQNVLLSFEGEVKVVDFGIALARHKVSKTQAGVLKGKFGYMSPEQVRGHELDHRSDVFACGILLWELLVGDRLFLADSDFTTLEKVRNVEMLPPTHFNKNLSPDVERVVLKALAKSRDERYRYASEMAEDLARYLYASNQPFSRADLQRYMHQHFTEEIKQEQERAEKYLALTEADLPPVTDGAPAPGSLGGESVTQVGALGSGATAGLGSEAQSFDGASEPTGRTLPNLGPSVLPTPSLPAGAAGRPKDASQSFQASSLDHRGLSAGAKVLVGALAVVAAGVVGGAVLFASGALSPARGQLTVEVDPPEAEIFLNDALVSTRAPFTADGLDPGSYVLAVKKPGFEDLVRSVHVTSGQLMVQSLKLERSPTASLVVRSTPPDLEVWLDGKDTGLRTPATVTRLLPGPHPLELRQAGEGVYRAEVNLLDNRAEAIEVDVARLPASLEVETDPPGAEVSINKKRSGRTPLKLDALKPGMIQVRITKAGCRPVTQKVELLPGHTHRVHPPLACP